MFSIRWLTVAMGLLGIAVVSATIALHSGENPGVAYARTATPNADQLAYRYSVSAPDIVGVGDTAQVSVTTWIREADAFPPGAVGDASYSATAGDPLTRGWPRAFEVVPDGQVLVDDVLDGAVWELRALNPGLVILNIRVRYSVTLCDTCEPSPRTSSVGGGIVEAVAQPGDANCDGVANSIDAALILQTTADIIDGVPCPRGSDFDASGTLSARDAFLVLQFAAGLIGESSLLDDPPVFFS
jgi:hypothetical protein